MKKRPTIVEILFGLHVNRKQGTDHGRTLRHEPLESRILLDASDYIGFNNPVELEYTQTSSEQTFKADISSNAELIDLTSITSSNYDDLVVVDSSLGTINTYFNNGNGDFTTKTALSTKLTNYNTQSIHAMTLGKFVGNDNYEDLFVVYQVVEGSTITNSLTYQIYKGSSTGKFTYSSTGTLSYLPANDTNTRVITNIQLQYREGTTAGINIQLDGILMSNGDNFNHLTYNYPYTQGSSTCTFGTRANIMDLNGETNIFLYGDVNSTKLGYDAAIGYNKNEGTFVFANVAGTTNSSYTLNFNSQSGYSMDVNWIKPLGTDQFVVGGKYLGETRTGGPVNGDYGVMVVQLKAIDATSKTITAGYSWTSWGNDFSIDVNSHAAVGKMGSDALLDLIVTEGGKAINFSGKTGTSTSLEFVKGDAPVISSPVYHSSTLVKFDGDDYYDLIAVGESSVWVYLGTENGLNSTPIEYTLSTAKKLKKAVFGYFDDDNLLDIVVFAGDAGGGNAQFYRQQVIDGKTTFVAGPYISPITGGRVLDIAAGNYTSASGTRTDLALLTKFSSTSTTKDVIEVFRYDDSGTTPTFVRDSSIDIDVTSDNVSFVSGNIYGTDAYEDFAIGWISVDTTVSAKVTLIENTGASLTQKAVLPVVSNKTNDNNNSKATLYVDLGDIDGDGDMDIACLFAPKVGKAQLSYALNTDGTFSLSADIKEIGTTTDSFSGIFLRYIDEDSNMDILIPSWNSSTLKTTPMVYLGNVNTTNRFVYNISYANATSKLESNYTVAATSIGKIGGKTSNSLVITSGKTVAYWINMARYSGASGTANLLIQNGSSTSAGTVLNTALSSARSWIDEFSTFYIDVWATTGTGTGISSFSVKLNYNASYFTAVSASAASSSFSGVTFNTSDGVVTVSGTGTGNLGGDSSVPMVRIYFTPVNGTGIPIPSDGIFMSEIGVFSIASENIQLNGNMPVAEIGQSCTKTGEVVNSLEDMPAYPVALDNSDDGLIHSADILACYDYYGMKIEDILPERYKILDIDCKGTVDNTDALYIYDVYGKSKNMTLDSVYDYVNPASGGINPRIFDARYKSSAAALPDVLDSLSEPMELVTSQQGMETTVFDSILPTVLNTSQAPVAAAFAVWPETESNSILDNEFLQNNESSDESDSFVEEFLNRTVLVD